MLKCIQGFFAVQPSIGCPKKFWTSRQEFRKPSNQKIAKKPREIVFA